MKAVLLLESGHVFYGRAFGYSGESAGEVVFNTSHTGYQEILSDPSYKGQIVTMTYPLIGNYGVNPEDFESRGVFVSGFIVREYSKAYSSWRATEDLDTFLKRHRVTGIEGIDTRALVKLLRDKGSQKGIISATGNDINSLKKRLHLAPDISGIDLVKKVTCRKPYLYPSGTGDHRSPSNLLQKTFKPKTVVVIDCGVKTNILRSLLRFGLVPRIVPASAPVKKILSYSPAGVLFSNGPGDPAAVKYAITTARHFLALQNTIPVMGICLGHQILGLAAGGRTYKLKFGHHGANQPIRNIETCRVEIASENHNYAVRTSADKVGRAVLEGNDGFVITHINLNDGTAEGMEHISYPVFSVQFHPEASPGPHDSAYLFGKFRKMIDKYPVPPEARSTPFQ